MKPKTLDSFFINKTNYLRANKMLNKKIR